MAKEYRVGVVRRLINWFVSASVNRGKGPPNTHILTTMGRRTSQPRSTPVTIVTASTGRYLVAPYGAVGWVHNLRARPVATLSRGGRSDEVQVRAVTPEEAAPILQQYLTDLERIVGPYFDVAPGDGLDAFVAVADHHPVFRIDDA